MRGKVVLVIMDSSTTLAYLKILVGTASYSLLVCRERFSGVQDSLGGSPSVIYSRELNVVAVGSIGRG